MNEAPSTKHPNTDLPEDVVLSVRDVSKKFCRNLKRSMLYGMKDLARSMVGLRPGGSDTLRATGDESREMSDASPVTVSPSPPFLRRDEFWALRDVSFELRRGETLGIVGTNGSGKTTLLRVLNGIFPPDRGEVMIRGQVGGLIALGAGFHPHMTGRENIFINGAVLGLRRSQIERQVEQIIDFADIREFIDAPVATYSSGMTVRLGFAIASVQEPDLLLLDEVLAVGDAGFCHKCYNYIGQMQSRCAVILVSHHMQQITQSCSKVLLLDRGNVVYFGDVETGVSRYLERVEAQEQQKGWVEKFSPPVESVRLSLDPAEVGHGGTVRIRGEISLSDAMSDCRLNAYLYTSQGAQVVEWNSDAAGVRYDFAKGLNAFEVPFGPLFLKAGLYRLNVSIYDSRGLYHLVMSYKKYTICVRGRDFGSCAYQLA